MALTKRRLAYSDEAERYALPLPRGGVLVGPGPTGKSLTARRCPQLGDAPGGPPGPPAPFDVVGLFAVLVGASEARTRE